MPTMTAPKKTSKKAAAKLTFAEIGRAAAKEAQRAALLAALEENAWNLTATAEALGMGGRANIIRALKELAPDEYERARDKGLVRPGVRPE